MLCNFRGVDSTSMLWVSRFKHLYSMCKGLNPYYTIIVAKGCEEGVRHFLLLYPTTTVYEITVAINIEARSWRGMRDVNTVVD